MHPPVDAYTLPTRHKASRPTHGFTVFEMMMVMVIVGIIATWAIHYYSKQKERAFARVLQASIYDLSLAQENYYEAHRTYTSDLTDPAFEWTPSTGVGALVTQADDSSWSAVGTHDKLTMTCSVSWTAGDTAARVVCQ